MSVRRATIADGYAIFALVQAFREEALDKTCVSFNDSTIVRRLVEAATVGNPVFFLAEEDGKVVGVIGLFVTPSYFDETKLMAVELIWYVHPDHRHKQHGRELLNEAEDFCRRAGIDTLTMIAGHYSIESGTDRILDRFYRQHGYKRLETHYIKKLGG